jgi:hypothetical protein
LSLSPVSSPESELRVYNSKVDPSLATPPSLVEVTKSIKLSKNSSAGPGGISFAAWRPVSDLSAPVLWRVLKAILQGHPPQDGFNHGLLFLLPKKLTGLF